MVFDAHMRAFEFFGGVTQRGIYDNMKTAVKKILTLHFLPNRPGAPSS
jgi:transposase